jgi:hypothetical protein
MTKKKTIAEKTAKLTKGGKVHATGRRAFAQGDVLFVPCDGVPSGARAVAPDKGRLVVAHSETGHDHFIAAIPGAEMFQHPTDPLVCFLRLAQDVELEHARTFDTHATFCIPKGTYEMRRQVEQTPDGMQMVVD